jgi:copper chaperone CopZ
MKNVTLEISGMSCGHCVGRVTKALGALPGVKVGAVEVGQARLEAEDAVADDAFRKAIDDVGFQVTAVRS